MNKYLHSMNVSPYCTVYHNFTEQYVLLSTTTDHQISKKKSTDSEIITRLDNSDTGGGGWFGNSHSMAGIL